MLPVLFLFRLTDAYLVPQLVVALQRRVDFLIDLALFVAVNGGLNLLSGRQ